MPSPLYTLKPNPHIGDLQDEVHHRLKQAQALSNAMSMNKFSQFTNTQDYGWALDSLLDELSEVITAYNEEVDKHCPKYRKAYNPVVNHVKNGGEQ